MKHKFAAVAGIAPMLVSLAACGTSSDQSDSGTITYAMWSANQLPAYQQCAADFHQTNPKITVKIDQTGYDDYWNKLTTGFVSQTAPDVFADHLSKYPEFAAKKQMMPLDDLIKRDNVSTNIYEAGLADLWIGQDGKRYGLPKDWDSVGIYFNKQMTDAAGLTAAQLGSLAWNPTDGGTYEKAIAHLTVDANGKRGDEPGFDKEHVKTYGLWLESPVDGAGQTQWSMYAASDGWKATNKNPYGTRYNYDDPKFQETMTWWKGLIDKGYMPPLKATTGVAWNDELAAGKAAMATNGDWLNNKVFGAKSATFTPGTAPLPIGPTGKRATMFNGLADSMYAGTKHKEAAWAWLKYLASPACQNVVAQRGVVFPAIPQAADIAQKALEAKGIDIAPFIQEVKDGNTFLYPITDHASQITALTKAQMDAMLSGKAPVSSWNQTNQQINALFQ